jgi:hypothetical protein
MRPEWLAAAVVILLVSWGIREHRRAMRAFRDRFPPLTDAEFIARCTPGVEPAVALKVRRIISESFGIEYKRIHPDARLMDDLGAD